MTNYLVCSSSAGVVKFNKNPAKLKYGNTDLPEELRQNGVFTMEKDILSKKPIGHDRLFAPQSGESSYYLKEQLELIIELKIV